MGTIFISNSPLKGFLDVVDLLPTPLNEGHDEGEDDEGEVDGPGHVD